MLNFEYESGSFIWDARKESANVLSHGIDFAYAALTFNDPLRLILEDTAHSILEPRYFCVGRIAEEVITVRFTYRENRIRIIGAGRWRKWRKYYEEKNPLR